MLPLLTLLVFVPFSAIPFDIQIAPDQILPIVFLDEPLIIAVSGPPNTVFEMGIRVTDISGEAIVQTTLNKPMIYPNGKYWISISQLPAVRAFLTANISIKYKNESKEWVIPFCRIERNIPSLGVPPVILHNPDFDGLYVAQLMGVNKVSFDSEMPDLEALIKKAISMKLNVSFVFTYEKFTSPIDAFEDLITRYGGYISTWEIQGNYPPDFLDKCVQILRKSKGIGTLRPSFKTLEAIPAVLQSLNGQELHEVTWNGNTLTPDNLRAIKNTITGYGGEGIKLCLHFHSENLPRDVVAQIQKFWEVKACGADTIEIPYSTLVHDGQTTQTLSFLCGISRFWGEEAEPIGWYTHSEKQCAFVFQTSTHWFMVFWGTEPLNLTGEGLATTQFFDSYGNPMPLPQLTNGVLSIDMKSVPRYLIGNTYEVLYTASANELKALAEEINSDYYSSVRTSVIAEAVKNIANNPKDGQNRSHVLNLFRELPPLEKTQIKDYTTLVQKNLLVAKLSCFLKRTCITEQFRGEPFREPLLDIIARSEEKLTEYLTGSASTAENDHRANWILSEVHQLIERASKITSNGKRIEATGLAYLAESRAQSLEFLQSSPITVAEVAKSASITLPPVPGTEKKEEKEMSKPPEQNVPPASKPSVSPPLPSEERASQGPILHTVKKGETIDAICKLYGITEAEFCAWNGVRKGATLKAGKVYKILKEKKEKQQLSPEKMPVQENEYVVQAGDYPGLIAKKVGVSTDILLKENNLTAKSRLQIGQRLKIPAKDKAKTEEKPPEPAPKPEEGQKSAEQEVKKDTESKPAELPPPTQEETKTTKSEPVEKREEKPPEVATSPKEESSPTEKETAQKTEEEGKPIEQKPSEEKTVSNEITTYKLLPGDTPAIVAKKFGVSVQQLMEINDIKDPTKLRAGEELKIPSSMDRKATGEKSEKEEETKEQKSGEQEPKKEETSTPPSPEKIHIVSKGDNPYTISKKYNIPLKDLLEANQLTEKSVLNIGQKLIIPTPHEKQ